LVFGPVFALAGYLSATDPGLREKFPINPHAGHSAAVFALHAATYLAYYAGWEFYFRGFLLFGLRGSVGDANAILIQVLASSLLHIGSPPAETFGAILGGLLWGMQALRTRSLIQGWFNISCWHQPRSGLVLPLTQPSAATNITPPSPLVQGGARGGVLGDETCAHGQHM